MQQLLFIQVFVTITMINYEESQMDMSNVVKKGNLDNRIIGNSSKFSLELFEISKKIFHLGIHSPFAFKTFLVNFSIEQGLSL